MWQTVILILVFGSLIAGIIGLAFKAGKKDAQLESLKADMEKRAREQAKANEILDNVRNFDEHTVRQRLHEIANHQR